MISRLKAAVPLALVIFVLAALWVEFSLNFTFHWVTSGDLGNGLGLPASFHLIVPTAFVTWGFFFAAGNSTLFRINRYPGLLLCSERSVGGLPIACCGSSGACPPRYVHVPLP